MKSIDVYINESIVDSIIRLFIGKTKLLQKRYSVSENSINEISTKVGEAQKELDDSLAKLTHNKVKNSTIWWKQLIKANKNLSSITSPEELNNDIFSNTAKISAQYLNVLNEWQSAKILDTPGIQYHIKRDIKQMIVIIETICKDNSKYVVIANQLSKIEKILENLNLSNDDANNILASTIEEIKGKGQQYLTNYKK